MATVETVQGPVDTADLGTTLMHEHLFIVDTEVRQNSPGGEAELDSDAVLDDAVAKLERVAAKGVRTVVDPTVIGLGRYIPRIQRLAERLAGRADVNIVPATGVYTFTDVPPAFEYRGPGTILGGPDPMVELFVRDIEQGIADTGVKAAFLKCATDAHGVTHGVERVLRAAAQAHLRTGAPIMTHTHAGLHMGLEQQRIFREEGVDLSRVIIGHSGDSTDLDYLQRLLDAGSILGMDRFGIDLLCPFEDRVATVAALCERGYAGRMVLAHDAACHTDMFTREQLAATAPNWHFEHIHDDVLPALRSRGVSDDQIEEMLVRTPQRFFGD